MNLMYLFVVSFSTAEHGGRPPLLFPPTHHSVPAGAVSPGPWRGVLRTQTATSAAPAPAAVQRWVSSAAIFGKRDAVAAPVCKGASSAAAADGQRKATDRGQR